MHLRGVPPNFGLQASYRPQIVRPARASLKPASVWKPTGTPPHVCLCVKSEVLIPELQGFDHPSPELRYPLIYSFLVRNETKYTPSFSFAYVRGF